MTSRSFVRTRIKICGLRDADGVQAAVNAGADAVGFVLVPGSPRCIAPDAAYELMGLLPPMVTAVGVVRDLSVDDFCDLEQSFPAPLMQLHGSESEKTVRSCGPGVIKGFRFDARTIDADLARWDAIDEVDALLIDGSEGGEGQAFDWQALARATDGVSKPIIIAGGLTPETVEEAIRTVQPYAVDVSTGVESAPGMKDPARIEAFCRAVHRANL
jgi:phosphoribosylanthranilate isomerase